MIDSFISACRQAAFIFNHVLPITYFVLNHISVIFRYSQNNLHFAQEFPKLLKILFVSLILHGDIFLNFHWLFIKVVSDTFHKRSNKSKSFLYFNKFLRLLTDFHNIVVPVVSSQSPFSYFPLKITPSSLIWFF